MLGLWDLDKLFQYLSLWRILTKLSMNANIIQTQISYETKHDLTGH